MCVSDLHTRDIDPPEGDLLINCGDHTFQGTIKEIQWYRSWLDRQKPRYQQICWINGNHDFNGEYWGPELAKETGTIYLQDSLVEVLGLKIYGSPCSPTFGRWAFMRDRGNDIRQVWEKIPEGLDICMTHSPPFGINDWVPRSEEHAGCWDLLDILKKRKPKYHVSGHLHWNGGLVKKEHGITFINAAVCNEEYSPNNQIVSFEI